MQVCSFAILVWFIYHTSLVNCSHCVFLQGIKKKKKQYSKSHTHTHKDTHLLPVHPHQNSWSQSLAAEVWGTGSDSMGHLCGCTLSAETGKNILHHHQLKQGRTYPITAETGQNIPHHSQLKQGRAYSITVS